MSYLSLSTAFLAVAALGGLGAVLITRRRPHAAALGLTALTLLLLTAVFDTVMIAAGLFHYAPGQLAGAHIGLAPIEDFAYPLAGVLLLPALWTALRSRRSRREPSIDREEGGA